MMAQNRAQPWWRAAAARQAGTPPQATPAAGAGAGGPGADGAATPGHLYARGISKRFGSVGVLHEVSFTVQAGEFVTLLGPSGCGKTTLLRIIAGLETPDRGQVRLGAQNLTALPANRRPVNTVFQNYALFPHLSVAENVAFGLRARKVAAADVTQRVGAALEMLQLAELRARHPDQLSGGQKQRVALARALVNEPEVLLLDEPMSALDAKLRAEVQEELRRLQQRLGKTFILVTHDQDEAMTVSDRIMVMRAGRIVQEGGPAEVYEHPANRFVAEFLGSANLIAARRGEGRRALTALGELCLDQPLPWEEGLLAIRPEHVRMAAARPAQNGVAVVIREVFYRGAHLEIVAEVGGVGATGAEDAVGSAHPTLRVQSPPTVKVRAGEHVWLELAPEYLEVLRE